MLYKSVKKEIQKLLKRMKHIKDGDTVQKSKEIDEKMLSQKQNLESMSSRDTWSLQQCKGEEAGLRVWQEIKENVTVEEVK